MNGINVKLPQNTAVTFKCNISHEKAFSMQSQALTNHVVFTHVANLMCRKLRLIDYEFASIR